MVVSKAVQGKAWEEERSRIWTGLEGGLRGPPQGWEKGLCRMCLEAVPSVNRPEI